MIENVSSMVTALKARAASGKPVTIGIIGVGQMGTDLIVQLKRMPGIRLGAIAVRNVPNAIEVAVANGYRRDQVV